MQVQETHCIESGLVFNIGAVSYRRRIMVPLLLALAPGGKSTTAKHELFFNGNSSGGSTPSSTTIYIGAA